jgi:predicted aconitase with swiveling domain
VVVVDAATETVQCCQADLAAAAVTIRVIFLAQAVDGTATAIIIKAIQEAGHLTVRLLLVALGLILAHLPRLMQVVVVVAQAQQASQVLISHTTGTAELVE